MSYSTCSSVDAGSHVPRIVVVIAADLRRIAGQSRSSSVTHDGASHVTSDDVISDYVIVRVASEPVDVNIGLSTFIRTLQSQKCVPLKVGWYDLRRDRL